MRNLGGRSKVEDAISGLVAGCILVVDDKGVGRAVRQELGKLEEIRLLVERIREELLVQLLQLVSGRAGGCNDDIRSVSDNGCHVRDVLCDENDAYVVVSRSHVQIVRELARENTFAVCGVVDVDKDLEGWDIWVPAQLLDDAADLADGVFVVMIKDEGRGHHLFIL